MISVILYAVLCFNAIVALNWPWIGMVLAYVIAVFDPQDIWWWAFEGVRPFYWMVLPALAGFVVTTLRGKAAFSQLNTRLNHCMAVLWVCFTISYYFGPYVHVYNSARFYDVDFMFATLQKTFLTYFVSSVLLDSFKKLKVATLVMVFTILYMTYWANQQYFVYHIYGRLHGPTNLSGVGIYADENNFAVLFVVGAPFVYYLGQYLRSKPIIWLTWLIIPFSWHAIFLTASRGALLGVGASLLTFALRAEKKAIGALVIACFVGAFVYEAGDIMKDRSATITSYETEDSASFRIDAWKASIRMMETYPLTGVGFSSFGQAFHDFSEIPPRIAHNTFFQMGGEWGVIAAITYLVLVFSTLNRLRKNGLALRKLDQTEDVRVYYCVNEACLIGLAGLFVCSMFLSLQGYEVLYYLLLLSNTALVGGARVTAGLRRSLPDSGNLFPSFARRPARPQLS